VSASLATSISATVAAQTAPASAAHPAISVDFNVRIPMRDGVELSADIYSPSTSGRFPVIVVRNPYTKSAQWAQRGRWWAERGYVFVVQDVRGRGDSDGEFYPLVNEANDGTDTYNWAAKQRWSTGKVGGYGGSYAAWTQLYPVAAGNSSLSAMLPMAVPPDPDRGFPFVSGIAVPATATWLASIDGRTYQSLDSVDLQAAFDGRPLIEMDRRLGRAMPAWRDWISSGGLRDYWVKLSYQSALVNTTVPALWITGWYDDVLAGATENFSALTDEARSLETRERQWLVIGPWGHAINAGQKLGDIDFGPDAVIGLEGLQRRWYDRWLKGDDKAFTEPRVRIFVMGSNKWASENEWPIKRTRYVRYFLHSGGKANTLNGDGSLSPTPPASSERSDRYRFDPDKPTPYTTGLDSRQMGGPDDYREVEKRGDVLVYSTPVMTSTMRACGPVKASLFATSSARDTDFTAKLLDVHPDGYAQRLNDGIVRARFRHGTQQTELLTPGRMESYSIDLWSTCIDVLPGHRLRLEISSSAAGKFDVNLNTGGDQATETRSVPADQQVHHDALRPSHILLPIVPSQGE